MADIDSNASADSPGSPGDPVIRLWNRWQAGDSGARDQLIHQLLPRLRERLAVQLTENVPNQAAEVTTMVVDALGRWFGVPGKEAESRRQLTCLAAECMRRILVEAARSFGSGEFGGEESTHSALETAMGFSGEKSAELIQVDEALDELATFDADGALAVTLRYFGGLSHPETAAAMDLSEAKGLRVWVEARAWLYMQFQPDFLPQD